MAKLQGLLFALATVVLVVVVHVLLHAGTGCRRSSPTAAAIDHAIAITLVVTGVVFIVTNLLLAWFGWRYQDHAGRARRLLARQPEAGVDLDAGHRRHHVRLPVQRPRPVGAGQRARRPADAMLIEVTGQQFAWNVRYPGPDGVLGRTDHAHGLAGEPDRPGRRTTPASDGRRPPAEPALPAPGPPGARPDPLHGRDPQLLPAQLPREAGRDARHDHRDLVRAQAGRRLRDRLRRALRPRPLPDARARCTWCRRPTSTRRSPPPRSRPAWTHVQENTNGPRRRGPRRARLTPTRRRPSSGTTSSARTTRSSASSTT